jgi:hypothetical protein
MSLSRLPFSYLDFFNKVIALLLVKKALARMSSQKAFWSFSTLWTLTANFETGMLLMPLEWQN